jgi:hypothetical protein
LRVKPPGVRIPLSPQNENEIENEYGLEIKIFLETKQKPHVGAFLLLVIHPPFQGSAKLISPCPQNENEIENEYGLEIKIFLETKQKPHVGAFLFGSLPFTVG